ncbi:hypothetical protein TrVE_jg2904, partial [Triparma verrucosa]
SAYAFNQDLSLWCVVTQTSKPPYFGYVGIEPIWGAFPAGYEGVNCETKTPCDTCSNGGVASGFIVDNDCACDCTAIDYEGANCETKVTASGAKLGSAEQAGLAAAGCVVFLGLCLAVYNMCYKSKSDTFKAEGLKVVEGGGNASYELASAQPIKSVHTEL